MNEVISTPPVERLSTLLRTLACKNRFYAPRLRAAGLAEGCESVEEFCSTFPFTTKADLVADQAAFPPYGTNFTDDPARYIRFCQTSGTTSAPLSILDTAESWSWMLDNWDAIYSAAGVEAGARVYFAFSFGPFLGFWTAFEAATRRGCLSLPGGGLSSVARLQAMLRHQVEVLCCTPTYAIRLAESAREEGIDLAASSVRKIIVAGEPGGSVPAVKERISSAWGGAHVFDHYGLTEVGPVAYQLPEEPSDLRIIESSYLAEVIQPQSGEPVATGVQGELVLTTLGRTACPLLRYRTGDLVLRDSLRQGFVLQGGVLGRADDMIVVRGVNIYPSAVDAVVRGVAEIAEYRVHLSQAGPMWQVELEAEASPTAAQELERAMSAAFSLRIPVRPVAVGTLPRAEMKARRWIRHT